MFTSAHVSNLALRYWFLLWCGFSWQARLVMRWWGVGNLDSVFVLCIFTCRQNDSSLEVRSLNWPHMQSSCTYITLACNWCALGFLLLIAQDSKLPTFITGLALKLACRTFKPFNMFKISTLGTSISSLMCLAWIKSWLVGWSLILVFTWIPLVTLWSWLLDLNLWEFCFHLALLGWR